MTEITPEKTHALLEKLAEYVMAEFPKFEQEIELLKDDVNVLKQDVATLKQDVASLKRDVGALSQDVDGIKQELARKADKFELEHLQIKVDLLLEKQDAQSKQLDIMRAEQHVFAKTFELHHKRLERLEEESSIYRIRDVGAAGSGTESQNPRITRK